VCIFIVTNVAYVGAQVLFDDGHATQKGDGVGRVLELDAKVFHVMNSFVAVVDSNHTNRNRKRTANRNLCGPKEWEKTTRRTIPGGLPL